MDAARLAYALRATRSGRQWKCKCVAHEDSSPSMIIFDGKVSVQVRCLAGCDQRDIISELKRRGLWSAADNTRQHSPAVNAQKVSHETVMRDRARALFDGALLCAGTPAEHYLAGREIWSVAKEIEDIRFSMRCPREQYLQPALIVAMRHMVTGAIEAVQRIFISQDVHGRVIKDGKPMMLGPVRDCAMMLAPIGKRGELHVAEGLESALSVRAMDYSPVWALGSCGAIERMPVLDDVDSLLIWADHDAPGIRAAAECLNRWECAGRDAKVRLPNIEGQDAADVWRARCAR